MHTQPRNKSNPYLDFYALLYKQYFFVSLKKAWHLMRDRGDVTLPVIEGKKLAGIITIGDIANGFSRLIKYPIGIL